MGWPSMKIVVKNTFFEVVDDVSQFGTRSRSRAFTDTELLGSRPCEATSQMDGTDPEADPDAVAPASKAAERVPPHYVQAVAMQMTAASPSSPGRIGKTMSCPVGGVTTLSSVVEEETQAYGLAQKIQDLASRRLQPEVQADHQGTIEGSRPGRGQGPVILVPEHLRTTVMLRNLPGTFSRDALVRAMNGLGLYGRYDFVYLPIDFRSGAGLGYAFVNMVSPADALEVWDLFEGFTNWEEPNARSPKVCTVSWSAPHQGVETHVDRYRNSPVMHPSVPEAWQPALFERGVHMQFPPPTKKLKAPKLKPLASEAAANQLRPRGL